MANWEVLTMNNAPLPELLTVEQFAEKLMVSRTTVFTWLKSGYLVEGKHYFRRGRIIRFTWDTRLFLVKPAKEKKSGAMPRPKVNKTTCSGEPAVNLEYC